MYFTSYLYRVVIKFGDLSTEGNSYMVGIRLEMKEMLTITSTVHARMSPNLITTLYILYELQNVHIVIEIDYHLFRGVFRVDAQKNGQQF